MSKRMTNSPAYLWYPKDIMSSGRVAAMSALEELWYRRALDQSWLHEGLPADPTEFAGWVGRKCTTEAAQKIIEKFFRPYKKDATKVVNPRQEEERKKFLKKSKERSKAGIESGRKRRERSRLEAEQLLNKTRTKTNIPIPISIPISSPNGEEENATAQAIHTGTILAGVIKELNVKKLSPTSQREWASHADLAFENGFTFQQFLDCYKALREKHRYKILPEYVTNELPEFTRKRKVEVLPTAEQKLLDATINDAAIRRPPTKLEGTH